MNESVHTSFLSYLNGSPQEKTNKQTKCLLVESRVGEETSTPQPVAAALERQKESELLPPPSPPPNNSIKAQLLYPFSDRLVSSSGEAFKALSPVRFTLRSLGFLSGNSDGIVLHLLQNPSSLILSEYIPCPPHPTPTERERFCLFFCALSPTPTPSKIHNTLKAHDSSPKSKAFSLEVQDQGLQATSQGALTLTPTDLSWHFK